MAARASSRKFAQAFWLRIHADAASHRGGLYASRGFGDLAAGTPRQRLLQAAACIDVRRPSTSMATGAGSTAAAVDEKRLAVLRKKMKHQARSREDALLADFLVRFVENHSEELSGQDLLDWQRLMDCEDELLMNLLAGYEDAPEGLDTGVLQKARAYLATAGPRNPFLSEG
mmetsp:Transcript_50305/g.145895  ORF Transcript_50305/g.145895 Transcript_50305/m.145895 type:complete len:172 (-) Transcript_50305:34-549(-)